MKKVSKEKLEDLRIEAEKRYKKVGVIVCPYFNEPVLFSGRGLEHIKFKGRNQSRSYNDQYVRLRYLYLAPIIVAKSATIQGIVYRKEFLALKRNKRRQKDLVDVYYFEFIAVMNGVRVCIIVRQVKDSPKHFWSIVPLWKSDKYTGRRVLGEKGLVKKY